MRQVKGMEGVYSVSESGKIVNDRTGEEPVQSISNGRYRSVNLWVGPKRNQRLVHRVVAEAYLPNPKGYRFVEHIDGRAGNNSVDNLRWVSRPSSLSSRRNELKVNQGSEVRVIKNAKPLPSRRKVGFNW